MLYHPRQPYSQAQSQKRKTKEGDWICINCFNYNYAFRQYCTLLSYQGNRCRCQQRKENERLMNAIGKENYGENSFPSVLFLQYPNRDNKQNTLQPLSHSPQKVLYVEKSSNFTSSRKQKDCTEDIDSILNENFWISNLIGE